jgi:hypothetical protein
MNIITVTCFNIFAIFHRFGPYFCEPVVAGLLDDNTPFLSGKAHHFYDTYLLSLISKAKSCCSMILKSSNVMLKE